jgi:cell division protein FtsL
VTEKSEPFVGLEYSDIEDEWNAIIGERHSVGDKDRVDALTLAMFRPRYVLKLLQRDWVRCHYHDVESFYRDDSDR